MRLFHLDWSSDYAIFFMSVSITALVLVVLLERASPKRKKRRRIDQRKTANFNELID